jgi:hypothetical protein
MTLQNIYIQVLLIMRKELRHRWYEFSHQQGLESRCYIFYNLVKSIQRSLTGRSIHFYAK